MERLQQAYAWANEQLDAMSRRDRMLLTGLVSGLALLIALFILRSAYGVVEDANSRLAVARERLVDVRDLVEDQRGLAKRIAAVEAQMERFDPSQTATYVERWAQETGVAQNLKEVRERGSNIVGAYRERDYRVELDKADLKSVLRFLHAIETAEFPVRIRTASLKARDDRRVEMRMIDLDIEIVTFSRDRGEG